MNVRSEPLEYKLPYSIEQTDHLKLRCAQLFAIIQKQTINQHDTKNFDIELQSFLQDVYNDGYNKGLAHMNKMLTGKKALKNKS